MDCLYGKLNTEVEKVYYEGLKSNTAEVVVDNTNSTIKVDVNAMLWAEFN